ncbi:MAG TPA: orotate phosphoribosyltransferase [Candidatus Dormibacteraeota bacterium]|jgi:orotate phosphoribosyltransferase|nr:orotate phosphoribosyltransferase [Candidatus Dormibacteraeota bacterium]
MPRAIEEELPRILVHTGALKFGVFTLSGGKLSPYYLDLRIVPSFPDAFKTSIELLTKSAKSLESIDKIGGIPTGGLPWASVLAYSLSKPLVYVRKEIKHHGREKMVEGMLRPGDRVLLVDDVITTGHNILSALQILRAEGGVVDQALVLVDREEGGEEHLRKEGVNLHSVTRISELAKKLLDMDAISQSQFEELTTQLKSDPAS